jgi:hypothetical protein
MGPAISASIAGARADAHDYYLTVRTEPRGYAVGLQPMPTHAAQPPNLPWIPISFVEPVAGYASVYLSDNAAKYPIRGVTLPYNNKSDPNLETQTFGLFSTCERQMRAGIVMRGARYIFFLTRCGAQRAVTGYYRLAWYATAAGSRNNDFALAADHIRFIYPIMPVLDLPTPIKEQMVARFRIFRRIDPIATRTLVDLIEDADDRTADYLAEIDRLERLNRSRTGYRCWRRRQPFTWDDAAQYLQPAVVGDQMTAINESPTNWWLCTHCGDYHYNMARLKMCPSCAAVATLAPTLAPQHASGAENDQATTIH